MSTHAIIAAEIGGKVEGRYVHMDGYPTGVGRELARIIKRDGLDRAIKALLLDHGDWSYLCHNIDNHEGFGILVPDYGVANGDSDEWYPVGEGMPERAGAHWAYIMGAENIDVFKMMVNRWHWFDTCSHEWMLSHDITQELPRQPHQRG